MIEYFTLKGMGLLRTDKVAVIEVVHEGKWVDRPSAFKYFSGFGGDQLDPWPISEDEARKIAASLGVTL